MNGTAIANRLQNSFKIKDNNMYRSSYYWNFRTSSFKQVACLILLLVHINYMLLNINFQWVYDCCLIRWKHIEGMVFNITFNNISVISWQSDLLVEETGESHQPATSYWQTLLHSVVSRTPLWVGFKLTMLVVIGTDCIGSCKSIYNTIRAWRPLGS